jgi:uncharacterized protein YegP (UPF0339 family)
MSGKFLIYKDRLGAYRWRLRAINGQIVAQGDVLYPSKEAARRGAAAARRAALDADIVDNTDGD